MESLLKSDFEEGIGSLTFFGLVALLGKSDIDEVDVITLQRLAVHQDLEAKLVEAQLIRRLTEQNSQVTRPKWGALLPLPATGQISG